MGKRTKSNRAPVGLGEAGRSSDRFGVSSIDGSSQIDEGFNCGEPDTPAAVDRQALVMARFILEHSRIFF